MEKKYIVRLTKMERQTLRDVVKKFKGSSQRRHPAQVLLKADVDGTAWTDKRIAETFLTVARRPWRIYGNAW